MVERIAYVATVEENPGPFAFAVNSDGALLRLQFLDGAYPQTLEEALAGAGYTCATDPTYTAAAEQQLRAYCAGTRQQFTVPLAYTGTDWQHRCWQALIAIPFGTTRTYGEQAAQLGRPMAARAVGSANAANPIALVVPCHRLIGANGSLTGFAGGTHLKARLLAHEAQVLAASPSH